jgi:hypothetical protein
MTRETRLRALEMTTRTRSLIALRRWLSGLNDYDLALILAEASEIDREIACLILLVSEAEIASVVASLGHLGNEK